MCDFITCLQLGPWHSSTFPLHLAEPKKSNYVFFKLWPNVTCKAWAHTQSIRCHRYKIRSSDLFPNLSSTIKKERKSITQIWCFHTITMYINLCLQFSRLQHLYCFQRNIQSNVLSLQDLFQIIHMIKKSGRKCSILQARFVCLFPWQTIFGAATPSSIHKSVVGGTSPLMHIMSIAVLHWC